MGIQVSPGILVRERDLSQVVPNLSSTIGAIVGYCPQGNTDDIVLITSSQQFIAMYGQPVIGSQINSYFQYSALAFLEKGNALYCKRVINGALYSGAWIRQATGSGASQGIPTGVAVPEYVAVGGQDICFYVFACNPGAWGSSTSVAITNVVQLDPITSLPVYTFVIKVYTVDVNDNYTEVEAWTVSRQKKVNGYGQQQYLEDVINGYSQFIIVKDNVGLADTILPLATTLNIDLTSGADGSAPTDGQFIAGWNLFANKDDIQISIMINAAANDSSVEVQRVMKNIAEERMDCIAVLDVPLANLTSVSSIVNWRQSTQAFNTSYACLYAPWVKIYDSYNDVIVNVPPSGYVASQIAYNDYVSNPWDAPAGFNRGMLNVLGLTNVFTLGDRNTLYQVQINPLQTFRGEGNVIWGQKMEKTIPSALDRVNVRRLLITLEKSIATMLKGFAFEPNNEITRMRVTTTIEQYLDLLSSRGAFQTELGDKGYYVLCNATNNTPAVIDGNELFVDVYIKPVRTAEFIQLNVIITQTGASFTELVARGVLF